MLGVGYPFCLDSNIKTSLACAVPSPVCLVEVIQAGSTDTARLANLPVQGRL